MNIRMLEENQTIEEILQEITPPNGTGIRNHPNLKGQSRQERDIGTISDGTDTWDVQIIQTAGSMQRAHGHGEIALYYRMRQRYTQEEIEYMRSIGIEI